MIDTKVRQEVRAAVEAARSCVLDVGAGVSPAPVRWIDWAAQPSTAVALHPSWGREGALPRDVRERLGVTRQDLDIAADRARAGEGWIPVMAVANAWGYAQLSYGAWRTGRIAGLPEAERRLSAAVQVLDGEGPVAAYYLLANDGHLHGWGPAFFTRFLAAVDLRTEERAVMLTPAVAASVNRLLVLDEIAEADWPTVDYAFSHALLHRIAADVGQPVGVVENLLHSATAR